MRIRLGLLALGLLVANSVLAQGTVNVGSITGAPGQRVSVPINIDNVPNLQSLRLQLEIGGLNTATAVGAFTPGPAAGNAQPGSNVRTDNGLVEIALVGNGTGDQVIKGPGSIGTLDVTIPSTATNGASFPVSVKLIQAEPVTAPGTFLTGVTGTDGSIGVINQGTINVRNVAGAAGTTIYVNVAVNEQSTNLGGVQFKLDLGGGTNPLILAGPAQKGFVFSGSGDIVQAQAAGTAGVNVLAASTNGVSGPGSVVALPIAIPAGVPAGTTYNLSLSDVKAIDAANQSVPLTIQNGTLTVLGTGTAAVTVGTLTGMPGQTVQLPISISNTPDLQSLHLQLEIGGLTASSAVGAFTPGTAAGAGTTVQSNVRSDSGLVDIAIVGNGTGGQVIRSPGLLGNLSVTIPSTAQTGDAFPISIALLQAEPVSARGTFLNNVAAVGGSIQVLQAGGALASVSLGDVQGKSNTTVLIPVTLDSSQVPLGAVQLTIDTGALVPGNAIAGAGFSGPMDVVQTDLSTGGQAKVVAVTAGFVTAPTILFDLPVTIPETAQNGTIFTVRVTAISAVDVSNNNVPINVSKQGSVTVTTTVLPTPTLQIGNGQAAAGASATIDVLVSGVSNLGGVTATFNIGPLQAGNAIAGPLFSGTGDVVQSDTSTAGTIKVAAVSPNGIDATNPGVAFRIPLTVPAGTAPQTIVISAANVQFVDTNNNLLPTARVVTGSFVVSGATGQPVAIEIPDATVALGQTANLPISVTSNSTLGAVRFSITAPAGLTLGDPTKAALFSGANDLLQFNHSNGGQTLDIVLVSPDIVTAPGVLVNVPVTAGNTPGNFTITGANASAVDPSNNALQASITRNGTITVSGAPQVVDVAVDNASIQPGQTGNVAVRVTSAVTLGALRLHINIPAGITVDPAAVTGGALFLGTGDVVQATLNGNTLDVVGVTPGVATGPGVAFVLPVAVPAGTALGTTFTITPSIVQAIDPNNQVLTPGTATPGVVSVGPQPTTQVNLTAGKATGTPGQTVNVPVTLDNNVTLGAIRVRVTLPNGFTSQGVTAGTIFNGPNDQLSSNVSGQDVDVVIASADTATGPGTLFNLAVGIPATAAPGTYPVGLALVQALDASNNAVPAGTITAGSIIVFTGTVAPPVVQVDAVTGTGCSSTATVTVRVTNNTTLGALRFKLNLTAGLSVASPLTLGTGTLFAGANDVRETNVTGSTIDVVLVTPDQAQAPGTLFTFPVNIAANANAQETISVTDVSAVDVNNALIQGGTGVNSTVTTNCVIGPTGVVNLTVGKVSGFAGQTVQLPVTLDSPVTNGLGALRVRLTLPAGFTASAINPGTLFAGTNDQRTFNVTGQDVDVVLVSPDPQNGTGTLFTLSVVIPANATVGQTLPVPIALTQAIDGSNTPVPAGVLNAGSITVNTVVVGTVNLSAGKVTGSAGTTVQVPVTLDAAVPNGLGAIRVAVTLPAGFMATALNPGTLFAGANDQRSFNVTGNTVDVVLASADPQNGTGTLFSLSVAIPANAAPATYPVGLTLTQAIDANNAALTAGVINAGSITVPPVVVGAVNLTVGKVTGTPGSTVQLPVTLDTAVPNGLGALRVRLTLPTGFTATGINAGTLFAGASDQRTFNVTGQDVDVVLVSSNPQNGTGTLFSLNVAIPANAAPNTYPVPIALTQAIDGNNAPLQAGILNAGSITVTALGQLTINIGSTTATAGQTVKIPVNLGPGVTVGAVRTKLCITSSNPQFLATFTGVDFTGTIFNAATDVTDSSISTAGNQIDVVLASADTHDGPGLLYTASVLIPANAPMGTTYTITACDTNSISGVGGNNEILPLGGTNGVTVPGVITVGPGMVNPPILINIGSASGPAGGTVTLPVNLVSPTTVGAMRVKLCVTGGTAPNLVKITGVDFNGTLFNATTDVNSFQISPDGSSVDVALVSADSHMGPGLLFNVTLQIPAGAAPNTTYTVDICGANSLSGVDINNNPIPLNGTGSQAGTITVTQGIATILVGSVNVNYAAPAPVTIPIELAGPNTFGGIDVTLQLASPAAGPSGGPAVGALVPNSGKTPNDPNGVAEVTDLGNGKIRVVAASANLIGNGPVATFQLQPATGVRPWDSTVISVVSANGVSNDNTTITPIPADPLGNGTVVAGRWVEDVKSAAMAAPTVATVNGTETVFYGLENGELHAHRAADGTEVYMVQEGIGPIARRPTFKDNFVYITSTTGGVAKVDATNGTAVWKTTLSGGRHANTAAAVATDPTTSAKSVYVGTQEGFLVKLDDATGAEPATGGEVNLNAPVSADPAAGPVGLNGPIEVWVGAGNNVIQLDANLTPKKTFTAGGLVSSPPFISPLIGAGGVPTRIIAVGSSDGKLYAFNSGTGAQLGSYNSGSPIVAASYVDWPNGNLPPTAYLVNQAGQVHAVNLQNIDTTMTGQNLTGALVTTLAPNSNTAIIAVAKAMAAKYGYYTTSQGAVAGLALPAMFGAMAGQGHQAIGAYAAFAPAAAVGSNALIVNMANGDIFALPLLPETFPGGTVQ